MKKILSVVLALTIILSLSTTAFASGKGGGDKKSGKAGKNTVEVFKPENVPEPPTGGTAAVTKLQAEEAALAEAGVERAAVKSITAYKEYSHGTAYAYHVSFGVYDPAARQTTVYVYQMDLYTAAVLSANSYMH